MERYVCLHGHFYQPPRENPWLEDVELQDSAYPYHDWNARITDECYRQNTASRILSHERTIIDIVNNYASISFNFGPTLLRWLEKHAPDTYQKILDADAASQQHFSGHAAALAQAYNHMIMPLANERDKETQVRWALEDFRKRFHREPEGMWLPETAADIPTLEALARHNIRFTILAPRQAKRTRPLDTPNPEDPASWTDVNESSLDPGRPYLCRLPSGHAISLFFYDGPISQDIAYGGLLHDGENFANRILSAFPETDDTPRIVHAATDGESFGHHHRYGEMALAYCLHHLQANQLAHITVYAEFLEKFPPTHEVEIHENSSWSCVHGVERWRSNCGCCANPALQSKQDWRGPLRDALDFLRDRLADFYENAMQTFTDDPWSARNRYIHVINDRSDENVDAFLRDLAGADLEPDEKATLLRLLEMQRNAMLMYTSCGWFFDRLSGIENVQILMYAERAIQLARLAGGLDLEPEFTERLALAPTHERHLTNGRDVHRVYVEPARVTLDRVAAHYVISRVFEEDHPDTKDIYAYRVTVHDCDIQAAGVQTLVTCRLTVASIITHQTQSFDAASLHLGDHNLFAGVAPRMSPRKFNALRQKLTQAFENGLTHEVLRIMNVSFEGKNYSLTDLFRDQQRQLLDHLLESTWREIESSFRHIYQHNYAIMLMMRNMNMPLPRALATPSELVFNQDLREIIHHEDPDLDRLLTIARDADRLRLHLDLDMIRYEGVRRLDRMLDALASNPTDPDALARTRDFVGALKEIVHDLVLENAQNSLFTLGREHFPALKQLADQGDPNAKLWLEHFHSLADLLRLAVD